MDLEDGGSTSGNGLGSPSPVPSLPDGDQKVSTFHRFTQQNLPACKPILTPGWVITIFLLTGIIIIPVGLVALRASQSIVEIVDRYDNDCVPEEFRANKLSYIKDSSISKNCSRQLKVMKRMKAPINVYYQLDNFYQNHRRYVKSRSDPQLRKGLKQVDTGPCKPQETSNGLPIVPCGLIPWSLFNDSFAFARGKTAVNLSRKNIAWKSDREHRFGKDVYPLSEQEDLIVWMRAAALPSFRKLYGRILEDLNPDDLLDVWLVNNYNTYNFGGKKKLNDFLGVACVSTGSFCILIAVAFALLHVRNPRPCADPALLSWSRKNGAL
ncbi:unnamed protein product [Spirodela intermedia]|uniref:ALA-interacting subunit n=1 Tax=Spirodela intermedia TaxID=51605 RepID=A0A7I8IK61_SPIIN|nr:unnamed protein product [Spirodela intermedia]CAA6657894.1 unnamed protein product [Spirodela intermedia]